MIAFSHERNERQVQVISRAGKASGKYESRYTVKDFGIDILHPLDLNTIDKWS